MLYAFMCENKDDDGDKLDGNTYTATNCKTIDCTAVFIHKQVGLRSLLSCGYVIITGGRKQHFAAISTINIHLSCTVTYIQRLRTGLHIRGLHKGLFYGFIFFDKLTFL